MGEDLTITAANQSPVDRLQNEIRKTEAEISETVHTLEYRLSPSTLKRQAMAKTRYLAWKSVAQAVDLVQNRAMPLAFAGAGAVLLLVRKRRKHKSREAVSGMMVAGSAAKGFLKGAARSAAKGSGTTVILKGIATAIGAAIGTLWYRQKPPAARETAGESEMPRAGAFPEGTYLHVEPVGR